MKKYITLVLILLLQACSESSNTGGSTVKTPGVDGSPSTPGTVVLAKLTLEALGDFTASGSLQVQANITDLLSDDAVYLHVSSAELDSGTIVVEPKDAMIYPSNKTAQINFLIKDNGVLNNVSIKVKLVTASGQIVTKELSLAVSE